MDHNPYFSPEDELVVGKGTYLPHWEQEGKIQFITFRLADSLPQCRLAEIKSLRNDFIERHPEPWDAKTKVQYQSLMTRRDEEYLNNGYGCCVLRDSDCRKELVKAIHYFDGKRYRVIAYVIMPNHVHLLLETSEDYGLSKIIQSIKRTSARAINNLTQRQGALWHTDFHDRIIRNRGHFDHTVRYIIDNPRNLPPNDYSIYICRCYPLIADGLGSRPMERGFEIPADRQR